MQVEVNADFVKSNDTVKFGRTLLMITPAINEDYWLFRVKLHEDQAIVAFPKFSRVVIGFAQEIDWNTNLPYTQEAEWIYNHIKHNKKYEQITDEQGLEAIRLIQDAIKALE